MAYIVGFLSEEAGHVSAAWERSFSRVSEGYRTPNPRIHNPMLYH